MRTDRKHAKRCIVSRGIIVVVSSVRSRVRIAAFGDILRHPCMRLTLHSITIRISYS